MNASCSPLAFELWPLFIGKNLFVAVWICRDCSCEVSQRRVFLKFIMGQDTSYLKIVCTAPGTILEIALCASAPGARFIGQTILKRCRLPQAGVKSLAGGHDRNGRECTDASGGFAVDTA